MFENWRNKLMADSSSSIDINNHHICGGVREVYDREHDSADYEYWFEIDGLTADETEVREIFAA